MTPVRAADQREPQARRVVVQLTDGDALRACVAAGEDVVPVASDPRHPIALEGDLEPACRLAQRAGPEGGFRHGSSVGAAAARGERSQSTRTSGALTVPEGRGRGGPLGVREKRGAGAACTTPSTST